MNEAEERWREHKGWSPGDDDRRAEVTYTLPMIQCSECHTPYVIRAGLSLATGSYAYSWMPDCKHRGKRPDAEIVGGNRNPKRYSADGLAIMPSVREGVI